MQCPHFSGKSLSVSSETLLSPPLYSFPILSTSVSSSPSTRNLSFDVLRILACVMVVVMHAQPTSGTPNGLLLSVSSYATAPCIGLFFMISGALRLSKPITDFRSYLRNITLRIVLPVLVWNILYGIILHGGNLFTTNSSWQSLSFLWQLNNPTLWFIFPLLGLYLLTPILQPWVEQAHRKQQLFFLLLWALTLCWPWWERWLPLSQGTSDLLYYFSGYVGYSFWDTTYIVLLPNSAKSRLQPLYLLG